MSYHPPPVLHSVMPIETRIDTRVFSLIEALIPQSISSLEAKAFFIHEKRNGQAISCARVIQADPQRIVIEFADAEVSRRTSQVWRLSCEIHSRRVRLLDPGHRSPWGRFDRGMNGLPNRFGKNNAARELGQCLVALQEASSFGAFQAQQKDHP